MSHRPRLPLPSRPPLRRFLPLIPSKAMRMRRQRNGDAQQRVRNSRRHPPCAFSASAARTGDHRLAMHCSSHGLEEQLLRLLLRGYDLCRYALKPRPGYAATFLSKGRIRFFPIPVHMQGCGSGSRHGVVQCMFTLDESNVRLHPNVRT